MKLTREEAVVLLTCRPYLDVEADAALRRSARHNIDWAYVLWRAEFFRTIPLLRYHLARADRLLAVPEPQRSYLDRWSELSALRSALLYEHLRSLVSALSAAGIEYQLIKGSALAPLLYPDRLLRPIMDLDVMVYPWTIARTKQVLQTLGYVNGIWNPTDNVVTTVDYGATDLTRHHELPTFLKVASARSTVPPALIPVAWKKRHLKVFATDGIASFPVFADVHLNLSTGFDLADVWHGVHTEVIDGRQVRIQSWTTMLWFLAARLYHEAFEFNTLKLIMFGDVHTILYRMADKIDWSQLLQIADKYGMQPPLYYVLSQARQLMRAPVPDDVLHRLRPDSGGVPKRSDWGDVIPKLLSRSVVHELSLP